jgi:adenosine deaminase
VKTLVIRQCLQDKMSLRDYMRGEEPSPRTVLRRALLSERRLRFDLPDHYFQNWRQHNLQDQRQHGALDPDCVWHLVRQALEAYAEEYLEYRGDWLHVRFARFGKWQDEITAVAPLPLIAYKIFREYGAPPQQSPRGLADYVDRHLLQFTHSMLIAPYVPAVDDLIRRHGLNEVHLHLNGSTEVDILWQDALRDPVGFGRIIRDAFGAPAQPTLQSERLAELYDQVAPGTDPAEVVRWLSFARRLRIALLGVTTASEYWTVKHLTNESSDRDVDNFAGATPGPLAGRLGLLADRDDVALRAEVLLLVLVYQRLQSTADPDLAQILHAYLLAMNVGFVPFCVQQIEQRGFDQFQKLTYTDFRGRAEQDYRKRFQQLSLGGRDLCVLEGRFSPPDTATQLGQLLTRIIRGYRQYRANDESLRPALTDDPDRPDEASGACLRLIAHFIKKDELASPSTLATCRFERLRNEFAKRWRALRQLREEFPAVRHYVTGIDGAANELHTPPEVFAPLYRAARRAGMVNFTFHVGEDFTHLLSGIRAVHEAVDFLGLGRGNRLGHATAIGIDPERYLDRVPEAIVMRCGDRLDDLVFAYKLLSICSGSARQSVMLQGDIRALCHKVYEESCAPEILWAAWELRHLDALRLESANHWSELDPDASEEIRRLCNARSDDKEAFKVFHAYHHPDVIKRATEYCSGVKTAAIDASSLTLLQNWVMENKIIQKGMVLETLPTSNVRISFYRDYREHHIYRWLGLRGDHPTPTVCVGSDDPGIFACNLRGEYMHLFREIAQLTSDARAQALLHQLNDAGRLYHFKNDGRGEELPTFADPVAKG